MDGQEPELKDMKARLKISEKIFDEVLKANLHQSEIATNLLIPIAFLTGAATFLFKFILDHEISLLWGGVNLIPIFFLLYIFFTLCGIFVFFEVIGPSFYTKKWPVSPKGPKGPKSTLFFKLISKIDDVDQWVEYFSKKEGTNPENYLKIEELQQKLVYDYAVESFQLAKKAQDKARKNLIAHMFFYPSFGFLLLMAFSGMMNFIDKWNSFTGSLAVIIVVAFLLLEVLVIRKYRET